MVHFVPNQPLMAGAEDTLGNLGMASIWMQQKHAVKKTTVKAVKNTAKSCIQSAMRALARQVAVFVARYALVDL
jgi:glycerol dehydrogenase-like iron-containing ADH family enzyme